MINFKWIKNNKELFIQKMLDRGIQQDFLHKFFILNEKVNDLEQELNKLRQERNLLQENNNSKNKEEEGREIRKQIQEKNLVHGILYKEMEETSRWLPNILHNSVCKGIDEKENIEVRVWKNNKDQGNIHNIETIGKSHDEFLDKKLVEQTHIMSASRFTGLKGEMAILHRAIGSFALDFLKEQGFTEHCLPYLLNTEAMTGSGHLPFFDEDLFWLENKKLALIPTSEVSIANLMKDKI